MPWFAWTKRARPGATGAVCTHHDLTPIFQAFFRISRRMASGLLKPPSVLTIARLSVLAIVLNLLGVSLASAHASSAAARPQAEIGVSATILPSCEITSSELASLLLDDAPVQFSCANLNPLVETAPEARMIVDGQSHRVVITTINF
jgi:hypothetical protein